MRELSRHTVWMMFPVKHHSLLWLGFFRWRCVRPLFDLYSLSGRESSSIKRRKLMNKQRHKFMIIHRPNRVSDWHMTFQSHALDIRLLVRSARRSRWWPWNLKRQQCHMKIYLISCSCRANSFSLSLSFYATWFNQSFSFNRRGLFISFLSLFPLYISLSWW